MKGSFCYLVLCVSVQWFCNVPGPVLLESNENLSIDFNSLNIYFCALSFQTGVCQ